MRSLTLIIFVAGALAASACDWGRDTAEMNQPAQPQPGTAPATVEPAQREAPPSQAAAASQNAIEAITSARCERESRCKNIGPDEDYASLDACKSEIRSEWKDDLNAMECGAGVVQKELDECLEQIRNENCANPFDTLGRMGACRSNDICKELAAR